MKITFLGTGTSQGIPMIANNHPVCLSEDAKDKRLRSSIMISWGNYNYVIDCGPDFRQQMLREKVQSINGILFTHEHSDHTAGFDDIRPYCFQIGEMPIYGTSQVFKSLEKRFEYIFATENRYPGAPTVVKNSINESPFYLGEVKVTPVKVMHGKLPVTAYRFGNVAYLTDVKTVEKKEKEKLLDLDVLIVNALRLETHPTHLNLEEALSLIEELNPKKAYLTHISHKLGFHKRVQETLPNNIFLAFDGLQITL
ncbi:MBL fold metallo-hydrolase [Tenacibaculum maritimum]|uniref:Metallo-beta-lactamase superfamily protein n=1 Tax=Tenacibaculum maritimum NCIMB 2154 TaxID=1349785 RepID=A0A2H1E8G4_9FLAO|nr:MBL fold metallo-hydrolase [Tenacibaculum maritimum]CAA0175652.1 Metallo-hydrolase/oxidoreductase superfamily protein [Tenacibaculum maritimum]CAA0187613.1 Metallo-hydrolase/oxidoreductase superfamily protein [Tenacibaculum maritimum]CAA0203307.1 Metallo-hydrolase/oxidoreductase superfamily protein [Tenacibaculum maritimum]CAA0203615.1 Metallo-hydrolase/oxidoreductase superfamily protein [Tenacibaculum maritimum]SFZ81687.1 Metallo-beta-lactamase superfamily protein [Tenacibaculum maritimum 